MSTESQWEVKNKVASGTTRVLSEEIQVWRRNNLSDRVEKSEHLVFSLGGNIYLSVTRLYNHQVHTANCMARFLSSTQTMKFSKMKGQDSLIMC